METTDDFLTGGGDVGLPSRQAENVTKTAVRQDDSSEAARKNRARRRAAIGAPGGVPPQLGTPGLLGLNPLNAVR